MSQPRYLEELLTPAAVIDLARMEANLDRMADYVRAARLGLRPHIKTHKTPELAAEQIRRGAIGLTCATVHEAEVMSAVASDILIAHPPVGAAKLQRLFQLPDDLRVTVALDSTEALNGLAASAEEHRRAIGVLVEVDVGMHRVGICEPAAAAALALTVADHPYLEWRGLTFYPGHIREHVDEQSASLTQLRATIDDYLDALARKGLEPSIVSGGSTPAAFGSDLLHGLLTEIRPGTYIFNDRTTAAIGACRLEDCAYTVLATVVSTAVPGQAVVDAGSKALSREEIRGSDAPGFGALLDRPDIVVKGLSEEHGILDLSQTEWRPRVGDHVRIVPNHVCVSVNLHDRLWALRDGCIEACWPIRARNWERPN
jgi:D-serine deaminase-like pyridoxal phosphate-dependent protein